MKDGLRIRIDILYYLAFSHMERREHEEATRYFETLKEFLQGTGFEKSHALRVSFVIIEILRNEGDKEVHAKCID